MEPFFQDPRTSTLVAYRPPRPTFRPRAALDPVLGATWAALQAGTPRAALDAGLGLLRDDALGREARAALSAALASAHTQVGSYDRALSLARTSLAHCPEQWLARRVLLDVLLAEQAYDDAFALAAAFPVGTAAAGAWDEPLSALDRHLTEAACAWLVGDWEAVARALITAYPGGVAAMPPALQEDWFRLAFYRERPADAADAARLLIQGRSADGADVLLQTLVKQGWNEQALVLYRGLYEGDPQSELLRRRLVGLCIRAGDVVAARKLMERGALKLASS